MDNNLREKYFKQLEIELKELIDPNTNLLSEKYSKIINCPLCGSSSKSQEQLFIKNGYTFVRCNHCEMIFTNPQVNQDLLGELYGESKANDIWVELQKSEKEKKWKKDYYTNSLDLICKFITKEKIRLLDIGCSTGYFLDIVSKNKPLWHLKGIELSENAYHEALSKGYTIEKKFINELGEEERFDIFSMFGVLEHIPTPNTILEDIKAHCNKNESSLVIAVVPNAYSLYHMFLQKNSLSFDGRNHLLYFSEKTLRRLFEQNDFKVLSIDTVLTGLNNIKNQIQWLDPYTNSNTDTYMPSSLKNLFDSGIIEDYIYKHNLGLRLRIVAEYS